MISKLKSFIKKLFEEKKEIHYPINIEGYRSYWGLWDIIREFISNAIDAENGNWKNIEINISSERVEIYNKGKSINIKDFYFGYSSQNKSIDKGYIGRFNEGMKLAIVVALRNGYEVEIYFKNYSAKPEIVEKDGVRTFKINFYRTKNEINGTKVILKGEDIKESEIKEILEKNLIKPNDNRIVYEISRDTSNNIFNYEMQIVRDEGKIFVGGLFISKIEEPLSWGYNFNPNLVRISEGRNVVNIIDVKTSLLSYMLKINSLEYWKKIFEDIRDNKNTFESMIKIQSIEEMNEQINQTIQTIRNAWLLVFGENAVVKFPDHLGEEASYKGAKVIKSTPLLESLASLGILPSCLEFIEKHKNLKRRKFKYEELDEDERKIYNILNTIVKKFLPYTIPTWEVVIYEPLDEQLKNEYGYALLSLLKGEIGIRRSLLKSCNTDNWCAHLIEALLEELTHAIFNTNDTSREHTDRIKKLATLLLTNPEYREFIVDAIYRMVAIMDKRPTTILEDLKPYYLKRDILDKEFEEKYKNFEIKTEF
ncbi:MAG: hypothetical protein QW678_02290 [Candidatus Aenigmatarchaeota archaeon]